MFTGMANMLYAFFCLCGLFLVWRVRSNIVTHLHQVDDAPLHHVAMPVNMTASPLVAALDPRVDEQVVQEQMQEPVVSESDNTESQTESSQPSASTPQA